MIYVLPALRVAVATLVMFGIGFQSRTAPAASSPVVLPVVLSVTGPFAFLGKQEADTLHILETMINGSGGLQGAPVHFDIQDDTSNIQVAVQLASALIAKGEPALLGFNSTAACNAVSALARNGPVIYCLTPGITPEPGGYIYSAGVGSNDIFTALIRFFRDHGYHRLAALWSVDAAGQEAERQVNTILAQPESRLMKLVVTEHFNPADLTVSAQMAKIANSGADACICFATGTAFGTILQAYHSAGMTMPLASSTGNMVYSQMAQFQALELNQLYFVGFAYNAKDKLPRGPVRDQVEAFYRAFQGTGYRADAGSGAVWDAARILVTALHDAGPKATPTQIRDWINRQKAFPGIDGFYDFARVPQRGLTFASAVVTRWNPANNTWIAQNAGTAAR